MLFNFKTTGDLVAFLVSRQITPNQALFAHLVYTQDWKSLYTYVHQFQQFSASEIDDLEDRGYVLNMDHHSRTKFGDMYVVTERLLDGLELASNELGEAFWELYPNFIVVQNSRVPAKSCDKDQLVKDYSRRIATTQKHEQVMSALTYAKKFNLVTMGIRKWVDSEQWTIIALEMKSNNQLPGYGESEF